MRKAGCTQISYGVESGSERIRKLLNKNIRTDRIKNAFESTTRYGILARAYFIYGCPGESWDTIQETIDLIHEIKPLSIIFYILDIFPGTALYADFLKNSGLTDDVWLKQIEDIMYFETDPDLSQESVLAFGKRLRSEFHKALPGFVDSIDLSDECEFDKMHADFLSRLGMTFSHGDYARVDEISDKQKIAGKLYERSLNYCPSHRAYLGLGIIRQQERDFRGSVSVLSKGIELFPHNDQMNICLGISYMNLGEYEKALESLLKPRNSEHAAPHIKECYGQLGNH